MPAKRDWVGMVFGRWTVKAEVENPRKVLCVCLCGAEREVPRCGLATGSSKSCGCLKSETMSALKRKSIANKLWLRTERKENGCLEWVGPVGSSGYGGVSVGAGVTRRVVGAHVAAWIDANGPVPAGKHVLHACDNRRCCDPAHLFLGDHSDNMQDMVNKGRAARKSGWDTMSDEWKAEKRRQLSEIGRKPKSDETRRRMSAAASNRVKVQRSDGSWTWSKTSGQMSH